MSHINTISADPVNVPKNIIMLHSSSDVYGASKITLITAQTLKASGINVHVVLSEEGPLSVALHNAGITVSILRLGIIRKKYLSVKGLINRFTVLLKARRALTKIVKQHNIDLIYSNTAVVLVGALVARQCRINHVWHLHEIIKNSSLIKKILGTIINRYSDRVVVVSGEVKKSWAQYIALDKIVTVHNGLDYSEYLGKSKGIRQELNIADDELLVGMIGRVNSWKGQPYFLEIAGLLHREFSKIRFLIVGDAFPGDEHLQDKLTESIKTMNLDSVVTYLGFRKDVPEILQSLDLFVLPSILPDPLPTVILEAMASGKPVVATAHGGALEMVEDQRTGVLIPWDNAAQAVKLIKPVLVDADLRKTMGDKGRQRALNNFSKESYHKGLLTVFSSLSA
jgi:glycosyltransferase involved in cell wall biosynthesis